MVPDMTVTVSQPKGHRLTRPTNWLIGPSAARRIPAAERRDRAFVIGADAYLPAPTKLLADAGAQIILSSAAWHPGEWGPSGEWEARSAEAGVPIVVCNRTGTDRYASFDCLRLLWRMGVSASFRYGRGDQRCSRSIFI